MMIRRMACLAGLVWILGAIPAQAACTGSGTTWSCPAGVSISDVQNAINAASDGATITFAAGSYTWGSQAQFSPSHGSTLICATAGACNVSVTGGQVFGTSSYSGTNTNFYRISGFNFTQSSGNFVIWFGSGCSGCTGSFTQVRIDHNTFNLVGGGVAIVFGENSSVTNTYGVVDHNTVNASASVELLYMIGAVNTSPTFASPIGTANNMFLENNAVNITKMTDAGDGCVDGWSNNNMVIRYNTSHNCLWTSHGVTHGGGPQNIEFYNNNVSVDAGSVSQGFQDCYRCFHHQGSGEFIAFNNSFTAYSGKNSEVISMLHYRDYPNGIDKALPLDAAQCNGSVSGPGDARYIVDDNSSPTGTYQGYRCWRQPGRDTNGNLQPMYVWNNYWSDTLAQVPLLAPDYGGRPDYYSQHMQANREWYNAVSASAQTSPTSPFKGTTGMGFGTLANRPTTCTTNSNESGGGVGYFATDQGAQGTLYQCSTTNTWTVWYTPYTYPHPLAGGLAPPQNLQAGVH